MPSRSRTSKGRRGGARRGKAHAKAIAGNAFLALLGEIRGDIDARLGGFLDAKVDAAREHGPEVVEMVAAIHDLCMRGGKRLRPGLLVAGYRATDASAPLEPALDAALALELMQAYFLIHDDWMDRDSVRRGGPAVHAALAERFRSQRIGHASGILAGDYAAALSIEALARAATKPEKAVAVFASFAAMQLDAVTGQQIDLLGNARDVEATYLLKTGSYTVRGPLRIGAQLAGAPPRVLTALDRFAMPMGVAFQLRDDLLSAFGDPSETGKPFGSDLKSGKRTALYLAALKRAKGRDHRVLKSVAGNAKASDAQVRRAVEVLERSGARAAIEARIDELVTSGLAGLGQGRITTVGRELLEGAARALTARVN
jgi:geranylgeranyl diphosphate synthase, type I